MDQFRSYLISTALTDEKKAGFYVSWVSSLYVYYKKRPSDTVTAEEIDRYLKHLSRSREDWQVNQASEAINLYQYFKERGNKTLIKESMGVHTQWKAVGKEMQKVLRLMHRSYRTEKAYINWVHRFYLFMKDRSPLSLEAQDVKNFMTYLAVERDVAISTQNQAFNAILFLFRYILDIKIGRTIFLAFSFPMHWKENTLMPEKNGHGSGYPLPISFH